MIKLTDIFVAVNESLLASFDKIEVYKEKIHKQKRPDMSVEIISFNTSPHSSFIINKSIDLDIIYFSKNNSVGEALKVADKLMSAFSMGLSVRAYDKDGAMVDKRHLHCLKSPEYKLVDQDLHFLARFDFADELEPYYLADDKTMQPFNRGRDPGQIDRYRPDDRGKSPGDYGRDEGKRPADRKDFVKDVTFITEEDKKRYEDEKIKLMEGLKLEYKIMEV